MTVRPCLALNSSLSTLNCITRVCSWESSQPPGTDRRLVLADGVRLLALVLDEA